jgi:hypothetical protein
MVVLNRCLSYPFEKLTSPKMKYESLETRSTPGIRTSSDIHDCRSFVIACSPDYHHFLLLLLTYQQVMDTRHDTHIIKPLQRIPLSNSRRHSSTSGRGKGGKRVCLSRRDRRETSPRSTRVIFQNSSQELKGNKSLSTIDVKKRWRDLMNERRMEKLNDQFETFGFESTSKGESSS